MKKKTFSTFHFRSDSEREITGRTRGKKAKGFVARKSEQLRKNWFVRFSISIPECTATGPKYEVF